MFRSYSSHRLLPSVLPVALGSKNPQKTLVQDHAYNERKPEAYFDEWIQANGSTALAAEKHTEVKKRLFVEFSKRIHQNNIPLVLVEAPYHPAIRRSTPIREESWKDYQAFLESFTGPAIVHLDAYQDLTLEEKEFLDFTHLGEQGRSRFTRYLGEQLLGSVLNKSSKSE